jgi:hypothetical protein
MPVDEFDPTVTTAELPLDAERLRGEAVVFSARARPVVLSDLELALRDEADDTSVHRERPVGGTDPSGGGDGRRVTLAAFLAHGAVVLMLVIAAMAVVAFAIAVAVR